ncbi:unnamed protein product [Alternaria burnsii]|nr:unnamed protein product [Alternaria burnsii]
MDLLEDRSISIKAKLWKLPEDKPDEDESNENKGPKEIKYCLDFDMNRTHGRMYLLKETNPKNRRLRTPKSLDTSSDEVFDVAQTWMKKCGCAGFWEEPGDKFYPKRLLDIEEIRGANGITEIDGLTILSEHGDVERKKVYLVETENVFCQSSSTPPKLSMKISDGDRKKMSRKEKENPRYVTLSHCWGKPKSVQGQLRLDDTTRHHFKREGIELRELPKTFRDAILFACRLDKVGFIWIDSMCIMQPTESYSNRSTESVKDWLEQSREMDQIYRGSFLNISATAAIDGDQGLFFSRRQEYLWEDEINVNYTGTNLFESNQTGSTDEDQLTRCTLIDVSFWDELVENAAVNRRGWVLQERLMAPRVLHFCRDQIAWECTEFEDAEGHPEMNPTLRAKLGVVVDGGRLKDLTPKAGRALRDIRLKGLLPDPDEGMTDLYIYELWKQIVEVYSRTQLTVSRDKLIALSGIARHFCAKDTGLFTVQNDYIVGMWSNNLASQLLWQVNELFRDGVFENPARRDATRAPSFSWASIDSPHGITYADVTDYKRRVTNRIRTRAQDHTEESLLLVQDHHIVLSDTGNKFGMVEQGRLFVKPRFLRAIELRRLHPPLRVPYNWRLKPDDIVYPASHTTLRSARHLEHANLYLDAPESDVDIFYDGADLHCMPVAYGERTVREPFRYLYCLLLKYEGQTVWPPGEKPTMRYTYPMFKRVGITKLSNHSDEKGQEALMSDKYNGNICLC